MKKTILSLLLILFVTSFAVSQQWFTSFKFAKRLAVLENKMIIAVWEESALDNIPVLVEADNKKLYQLTLFENEQVDKLVWQYFIPVILSDQDYMQLAGKHLNGKSLKYKQRFNDDQIKIMDPNGNIINTNQDPFSTANLTNLIRNYALNVGYLQPELTNYFENKSFSSTFRLTVKYQDMATFAHQSVKKDICELSGLYLAEAKQKLSKSDFDNTQALQQKLELLQLNEYLILGKARKVYKALKKINLEDVDAINTSLFAFLNYTSLTAINKVDEALKWKDQVNQTDLNKVKHIIKN